jgi:transposase InsO family protein
MDITYIPMARGFVYLAVVLDWFSRRVLSWRVSITMEAAFCVETLEEAMARHGSRMALRFPSPAKSEVCISLEEIKCSFRDLTSILGRSLASNSVVGSRTRGSFSQRL